LAALALVEIATLDPFATVRAWHRMRAAGFSLTVEGDGLVVTPASRLSERQRALLRAHKAALVQLLNDAETLARALIAAGPAGLGWREGTPADWADDRLLAAGEVLYGDGHMVDRHGRRNWRERALPADREPSPTARPPAGATRRSVATVAGPAAGDFVRCRDCRHAKPATASDPYSWHSCGRGLKDGGGWGMAPRRCEAWEAPARAQLCDGNASSSAWSPLA
jgi:hypothetical protein